MFWLKEILAWERPSTVKSWRMTGQTKRIERVFSRSWIAATASMPWYQNWHLKANSSWSKFSLKMLTKSPKKHFTNSSGKISPRFMSVLDGLAGFEAHPGELPVTIGYAWNELKVELSLTVKPFYIQTWSWNEIKEVVWYKNAVGNCRIHTARCRKFHRQVL